ncbi:MAG: heavy-metal-associated domain-containing protein [Candidatus Riflebacteria bacterium]|nr:heavy-metal-associated domain-containing protein [Candidatus Riflebacteria bacterium]
MAMNITWTIGKIKCDGCVQAIAEALLIVDGIHDVVVDLTEKTVTFKADDQASADLAKKALVRASFPPDVR